KYYGGYTSRITTRVSGATSGVVAEFNFQVLLDGVAVGSFPNLIMTTSAERYALKIVNDERDGSNLVALTDPALGQRPANGTYGPLTGGDDGFTSLDDNDFIGSSAGPTGQYALDIVDDLTLLSIPGRATSAVANAMITYCEVWRDGRVFAVLTVPEDSSFTDAVDYVENVASILETTEFGAAYWPWVKVLNPSQRVYGTDEQIVVSPEGHILGAYARVDAELPAGVYQAAANVELGILRGVLGFEHDESLEQNKRDVVYPKRINPLTTFRGAPRFIDGSRTLKSTGSFPSIGESRGAIHIASTLHRGMQFARHRNNTPSLRARVNRTATAFLRGEMNKGAFASRDPETAFFVDTSEQVNPPTEQLANRLWVRVGLAFAKPAEFVIVMLSADTRALDEELAG
ncbi:MAG: phage tail protein, partial [Gemmatimonadota bacterium]